jgi:hypothetical protein
VASSIMIADDDPDDEPWIHEGRHRITAMRDAGVRRTITIGTELVGADGQAA